jgi:CubicO group peptidase (beta-lactamase class C family)
MMIYKQMLILILLASAFAPRQADRVDQYIEAEMQKRRIPGLALAVIRDGKVIKEKAYGLANIELNVPASKDTIYQIASNTKTFTAAAVMLLVEEGKLSLDDKVTRLLPGLPGAWNDVSVRHCLTHTSGLPDLFSSPCDFEPVAPTWNEAMKILASRPLVSKPGETWSYNQTGYVLIGMIIEKITGMKFEEYLRQRFFLPLGMTSTRFGDYKEIVARRASVYTALEICRDGIFKLSRDKIYNAQPEYIYPDYMATAAGINSTAADMAKWSLALDSGRVLKQSSLEQMWTAIKLNDGKLFRFGGTAGFALGWQIDERPGHRSAGFSGGGSTAYAKYLDDRMTVIVLTNLQGSNPDSLVKGVAALYIPELGAAEK